MPSFDPKVTPLSADSGVHNGGRLLGVKLLLRGLRQSFMSLGGPSGGTKGSFKMDSGEDASALWAFTNAIRTKLRDVRLAMEDRWERQRAKKAIRAAEYVVQEGDSLLAIAER